MSSNMSLSWSRKAVLAALALAAAGGQVFAQRPAQPYAGMQTRDIKTLSREEMADLAAGRGMGLALAAELNGYPGPAHVLELADKLRLSDTQRTKVKQLFESMKSEAIPVGQKLVAAERDLNHEFAERTITPERLEAATAAIAAIRGELRNTHLKYHLATAALLSPDQIRSYTELRGYTAVATAPDQNAGPTSHTMPAHGAMGGAMHGAMHQHMMGAMRGE
jgi:hypothetical protein